MTRSLEEQGFVKRDGSGMPNCYAPDDLVDVVIHGGERPGPLTGTAKFYQNPDGYKGDWWKTEIAHHRRHISQRQQLDMAIEALQLFSDEYDGFEDGNGDPDPVLAKARSTLKTLKERQPHD